MPPASAYAGLPDSAVARNVARIYVLLARDIRAGTRRASGFDDTAMLHELVDAIERAAATVGMETERSPDSKGSGS